MTTTIALVNQKGGCGKSSTCFHLAGSFAEAGRRVLLVDADPQGSLSQGFFGSFQVENSAARDTLAAVMGQEAHLHPADIVRPTPHANIWLAPANHHLARFNGPQPETLGLGQFAFEVWLGQLADFDMVLIDCPPNLYACTWNALLAADYVLIPVPPEEFGAQGLRAVHQAITSAQALHPALRLLGHVVTRHDGRLLVHRACDAKLRSLYSDQVLATVIPEASAFKVALACREPVTMHSPRSKAAAKTRQLGEEIEQRIALLATKRQVA